MLMREPLVEFVSIDMAVVVTDISNCSDEAQQASMTMCDCSGEPDSLPGCSAGIV